MELQPTELHEEFLFSVAAIMVEKAGEFGTWGQDWEILKIIKKKPKFFGALLL
jgi:hypothetical protein